MLVEQPARRPNVFDILLKVHELRGSRPSRDYVSLDMWRTLIASNVRLKVEDFLPPQSSTSTSRAGSLGSSAVHPRDTSSPRSGAANNLLDFRSKDELVTSRNNVEPPEKPEEPVAIIQPQRRGRPSKKPVADTTAPTAARPSSQQAKSPPSAPYLNVTGESMGKNRSRSPLAAQPELVKDIKKFAADFGDAFTPDSSTVPRGSANNVVSPGFDDGFDGTKFAPNAPLTRAKTTTPATPGFSAFDNDFSSVVQSKRSDQRANSVKTEPPQETPDLPPRPVERPASPSSSEGQNDFDHRYPSVDELDARSRSSSNVPTINVLSKSPDMMKRPSIERSGSSISDGRSRSYYHQSSVTGGGIKDEGSHQSRLISYDENPRPLPRSTQVTGTAFTRQESNGNKPLQKQQPSFDLLGSLSSTDEAHKRRASTLEKQDTTSPHDDPNPRVLVSEAEGEAPEAAKTSSGSVSKPRKPPPKDLLTGGNNASFDDYAYQALSPTGRKGPPPINAKPTSLGGGIRRTASPEPMSAKSSVGPEDAQSSGMEKNLAGVNKPSKSKPLPTKPAHLRQVSDKVAKAQSDLARTPSSSEMGSEREDIPVRPATVSRRSSINEMVAKYEKMSSPKSENDGFDLSSHASGHRRSQTYPKPGPKPASKPAQLRAAGRTMGTSPNDNAAAAAKTMDSHGPPPTIIRSRSPLSHAADNIPTQANIERPSSARLPSYGSNKSNSIPEEEPELAPPARNNPRQQGSINSLIAHWNQGTLPVQGTHPSYARKRAPLGSGGRL